MGWRDVQRQIKSGELSYAPSAMDSFAASFSASFSKYYTDALDKQTDLLVEQKEKDAEDKRLKTAAARLWAEQFPDDPKNPNGVSYAFQMLKDYEGNVGNATARFEELSADGRIDIQAPPEKNYFLSAIDPNGVFTDFESGAGGYSALFNQAQNNAFSNISLTEMTMPEVMDFANARGDGSYHAWVKQNLPPDTEAAQRGLSSTPMGQYQFIGSTLKYIKDNGGFEELNITDETLFDEGTQNDLFLWYAQDRLQGAKSKAEQRSTMRSIWEGFRKKDKNGVHLVTNAQLDKVIEGIETGTLGEAPPGTVKTANKKKKIDLTGVLSGFEYTEDGLRQFRSWKAETLAENYDLTPDQKTYLKLWEADYLKNVKDNSYFEFDEYIADKPLNSQGDIRATMMLVENKSDSDFRGGAAEKVETYVYLQGKLDALLNEEIEKQKQETQDKADAERDPFTFYTRDKETGIIDEMGFDNLVYKNGKFYNITDIDQETPIDVETGVLFPSGVDGSEFIKIYNKPIGEMAKVVANGDNTIDNLLMYRQEAYNNPAAFNRTLQAFGGIINFTDDVLSGFNAAIKGGASYEEVLADLEQVDQIRGLSEPAKRIFTLQLQAAYDIARLNESSGQGLSDKELQMNLNAVGFGETRAEIVLDKINVALKKVQGRTEANRRGILGSLLGRKEFISFVESQEFGQPFSDHTATRMGAEGFDPALKEQFDLAVAGDNSTNQAPEEPNPEIPIIERTPEGTATWDAAPSGTKFQVRNADGSLSIKTKP